MPPPQSQVIEAGDFSATALVREVCGSSHGSAAAADPSRAEASANVEGSPPSGSGAAGAASSAPASLSDPPAVEAAVAAGSLERLLAMGMPRLEAGVRLAKGVGAGAEVQGPGALCRCCLACQRRPPGLLSCRVPLLHRAELLLTMQPDRLGDWWSLQAELEGRLQAYAQAGTRELAGPGAGGAGSRAGQGRQRRPELFRGH